jgi:hypothetical protein
MTVFKSIIFSDWILNDFLGQALREGLIADDRELPFRRSRIRNKQKVLSYLILFDDILLPDIYEIRIPVLEDQKIIKIIPFDIKIYAEPEELWKETLYFRPLILGEVSRLLKEDSLFGKATHFFNRRKVYSDVLEYILGGALGDEQLSRNNVLTFLPQDDLDKIRFYVSGEGDPPDEINSFRALYAAAIMCMVELRNYISLSLKYRAGIATITYTRSFPGWMNVRKPDLSKLVNTFHLLKCSMFEEGLYFPRIESIKQAASLRKDPNITAFREQVILFTSSLVKGDKQDAVLLRKEVLKANQALKRAAAWEKNLRLLTYFSLPINLIESFVLGIPLIGTTLSVFLATATKSVEISKSKNKWIIFGRS